LATLLNLLIICVERIIYPEDYYELVELYSKKHAVPKELVFAIIKTESNFDKNAKSHAGAMGLMQMIPSTYEFLSSKLGETPVTSLLYDPETNIKYGTYYLQYLYSKFGSWELVLAAYNWGEGNLSRFIEANGYDEGDYKNIPVSETRSYVKKVLHRWEKYEQLYK
jgi:soluble lytic murein transglycosylase